MARACNGAMNEHYSRGITLYDHGLYTEAIAEFERALAQDGQGVAPERRLASFYTGEAYANLGVAHMRMNMYLRAEEELKLALMIQPDYADLHAHLAFVYHRQGRHKEAEAEFRSALKVNPKFARALIYLGLTRLVQGQAKGLDDVSEAVLLEPAYCDDRYQRAMKAYDDGDTTEALRLLEEVAETDTDDIAYHLGRGRELLNNGKYLEAGNAFYEAMAICPHYADLRNYLGICYLHQGMLDMAVAQFRKAVEINPNFVGARMNLASAYEADGKTDLCIAELERVSEIDPGNPEVERRLPQLKKLSRV